MLKFLLFIGLFGYLLFKGLGIFFRVLTGGPASHKGSYNGYGEPQKPRDGNLNVDYVPNKTDKQGKKFKGGEYVDYEEVN
ncbi:DUF4834 domain-containing protein [Fulvivirga sp. M361]|uniref:DUF4834 domain-containing protein n=1 Tax=Fulvivirga sp. M361 TaxID=2594266 RepID=UPI00117ADAD9|nr:DUF4834 domain-containing protein [Fulvivirga sp. M361]TRX61232.1 DUF4834 domain-containing protein [Fulvivirga sp. M361]